MFLLLLYSCLGLGLVLFSDGFLRFSQARRDALRLESAAEGGVKDSLAKLVSWSADKTSEPARLFEEELLALWADGSGGGILAAEKAMGLAFPFLSNSASGNLSWSATAACRLERRREEDPYVRSDYLVAIDARGRLTGWPPESSAGLDLALSVMAGRLPLSCFPFLLAGAEANEAAASLLEDGRLTLAPNRRGNLAPRGLVSPRSLVTADASPLLAKAMKVRSLDPGGISLAILRQALGLPAVDEPVPDGVYLIRNDSGPGGIFVQGDLDSLLLGIDGGRQVVGFVNAAGAWRLSFTPGLGPLDFQTPEGLVQDAQPPLGIILVNGAIGSLSAAVVDSTGNLEAASSSGLPCLRDGQSLTIVSTDELVIDSDLLHEGVSWAGSVPYLKDKQSQLVVYAAGRDVLDGSETRGDIKIGSNAPVDVRIQASLTAAGSFSVEGAAKSVLVSGGVQTAFLHPGASRLTIHPDERIADGWLAPAPAPSAAEPVLLLLGFSPRAWRERT
ncbi:MAG: hypothetical protein PHI34_12890 [Acidobacteriota bacterium]|nr:hypothetical protein [Acidobacteriota bacterium]